MIKRFLFGGLLAGFFIANVLVYQHAAAMTDFESAGTVLSERAMAPKRSIQHLEEEKMAKIVRR